MSLTCCGLFSAVCAFTLVSASGCGTDAVGVDDCRDIEQARCAAAKNCGLVEDVDACQRFYRDQCLHGLAVSLPSSSQLKLCVQTITDAGMCAQDDAGTELRECSTTITASAPGAKTACDLVTNPALATECSFLAPDSDAGTSPTGAAGAGGAGGAGGASDGGSSGAEDAAGTAGSAGT